MKSIPEIFGSLVFNESVMREKLPKETYKILKKTISDGTALQLDVANVVANAMKDWAVEKGATHFTHWFQPMTGVTAEKHDSFISPDKNGHVIMEFSGKSLVKGESDASSFPSGGLRATFEARGYTAWDPTSYAFIKDDTLCIPTAFCSYGGEVLDKKTPLLLSMEAINKQTMRILRLFGDTTTNHIVANVGAEQEYFLIDRAVYEKRPDLVLCSRTLFGARPPKGQELDDHYYGALKPRVSEYMKELDCELWKLGVLSKTKHNEVAPAQHELAPVFTNANIATDHNQLTMEIMKKVAARHNLTCLLHEKPFAGVNGSGKHNNWSLSTDSGRNLLEPGDTPSSNVQFLLFITAVIKAVDEYQELLRLTVATAGNDHRLGANEAPPAIVSMSLGEDITDILDSLESGIAYNERGKTIMEISAEVVPNIPKDTTDRNRTSPFAFTGNKFEFRMPGSSMSISGPTIVLNTIMADVLSGFADTLEASKSFEADLTALIRNTYREHKRIVFNGNNYSDEWVREAEKRGLSNLKTTVEALPHFKDEKNIALFLRQHVFSRSEVMSRCDLMLESYYKTINIEALTMVDMVKRDIIPAVISYENELVSLIAAKKSVGLTPSILEKELSSKIATLSDGLYKNLEALENSLIDAKKSDDVLEVAKYFRNCIFMNMTSLRGVVDELETLVGKNHWPFPTYTDILYSVK